MWRHARDGEGRDAAFLAAFLTVNATMLFVTAAFASTEFGMNTFLRNLLEFFSSVSGVKSSHPQWEQFKENASKMAEASLSSAQPLKGKKVRVHAEERENKKKEVKVYAKFSTAA